MPACAERGDVFLFRRDQRHFLGVALDVPMAARTVPIGHVGQQETAFVLDMTFAATLRLGGLSLIGVRRAGMAADAGLVADGCELLHMTLRAVAFKNGVGTRNRTLGKHPSATAKEDRN